MMSVRTSALALTLPFALGFPVYDVDEGAPFAVNPGRGTAFNSVAALDPDRAIECFTDYGNGGGAGTCRVLSVSSAKVVDDLGLAPFVFSQNETHGVRVAAFSATQALVCYSDKGVTGRLICSSLAIAVGGQISISDTQTVDPDADEVPHLDVASLTHEIGVLCWSEPLGDVKDRAGVCNKLTVSGQGSLDVGNKSYFDSDHSTTDISVTRFSDASAMVCWSAQGAGVCRQLSLHDNGGDEFSKGDVAVFNPKASGPGAPVEFEGLVVVSFTETQGMVCYAEKVAQNSVSCKVLLIGGSALEVGQQEVVSADPSSWLTAVALTDEGALVCYATSPDGAVTNTDSFEGRGTCNIVGLTEGNTTVGAGPPNQVNEEATQHMSVAVLDPVERSAVLCYSDKGAGGAFCKTLRMAETTTSTTATSTSSLTTTSPHTTTGTSTTTESSTTSFHTTTETQTTTSPHTTTNTDSEDSGSASVAISAGAALVVVLGVAL